MCPSSRSIFISKQILLVTGDSDFVPAIKTARRNGIFVHLFTLGHHVNLRISNINEAKYKATQANTFKKNKK
ncbi:NYN domain-containing protein [bacterium]|nr:NYN domain-containing protein [bacterium]